MESKDQVVINVDDRKTEDNAQHYYSSEATKLASSMKEKLSMLGPGLLSYGTVCIYRVPEKHRNKNQDAYTPRIVSIGPLHHKKSQVQAMEEYKLKYLNNFLHTFRVPMELLAEYVYSQVKLICGCYEDFSVRDQTNLSQVILLDGVFVVELLLKNHFPQMREMGDMIFENRWVSNDVLHDLLLLENQLPMRFLCTLYNSFVYKNARKILDDGINDSDPPSFSELAHEYFKDVSNTGKLELGPNLQPPARHLVEFLAILHNPSSDRQKVEKPKPEFARCPTATALQAAGVNFKQGPEHCIFNVSFNGGELRIPQLVINDFTETFFRNSIAFEQSGYHPKNITSYAILLDNLIDTPKDVKLLIKSGIIDNQLGSPQQVADVFNNLYKEFVPDPDEFYFAKLCSDLNDYSRDLWHKWKSEFAKWFATLRKDYFGTPWSVISVVAASVLLVLTFIQAVCAILGL